MKKNNYRNRLEKLLILIIIISLVVLISLISINEPYIKPEDRRNDITTPVEIITTYSDEVMEQKWEKLKEEIK